MGFVSFLSNIIIPILIFYVVGYGLMTKTNIFDAFIKGAKDGFRVVASVLPTLIGLMMAIGIMRASGVLDFIANIVAPVVEKVGFPAPLLPLVLIKMFSSSAATGLLLDIYKKYGVDSDNGYLASLFMCCSETIFYTISVYLMATATKEHKALTGTRWILPGALICTLAGTIACLVIVK